MKKIVSDSIIFTFSGTLIKILSVVNGVIIARYLGPISFGVFSIAREFSGILAPISDFGSSVFIVKEGAQNKKGISNNLRDIIVFKLIWSLLIFIAGFIIAKLLYNSVIFNITIIFLISTIFYYFLTILNSTFMATNEIKKTAISQSLYSFFVLTIVIIMVLMKRGLYFLVIGRLLMTAIFVLVLYEIFNNRYNITYNKKITYGYFKNIFSKLLPYGISIIFYFVYLKAVIIIISILTTTREVGMFSSAYQIIVGTYFLPGSILRVVFPTLANNYKANRMNYKIKFIKSIKYIAIIGMMISSFLFLFSYYITKILYGNKYIISSNLLLLGSFSVYFESINIAIANGLTASNNQKYRAKALIYATFIMITITIILVFLYGLPGAMIALFISEIILFIILFYYINRLVCKVSLLEINRIPLVILVIVYFIYILFGAFLHIR